MTITTRYRGATNNRGARVEAVIQKRSNGVRVTQWITYDHTVSSEVMHRRAAIAVAVKAGLREWWLSQEVVVGETDYGYVHVPVVDAYKPIEVPGWMVDSKGHELRS